MTKTPLALLLLSCAACTNADPMAGDGSSTTGGTDTGGELASSTGAVGGSSGAPAPDTGSSEGAPADSGTSDDGGGDLVPAIPTPTGTCPEIVDGDVTFAPAGIEPRTVRLHVGDAAGPDASLVLYWHATSSSPDEAAYSLGSSLAGFTDAVGIVAAPFSDPTAGTFEWFLVNGSSREDDFLLADEIVGCLVEAGLVDPQRIHAMGMSAGGLQTTATSFLRSAYVASVATYSGGLPAGTVLPDEDPSNPFAALVFFGGDTDTYGPLDFAAASQNYAMTLQDAGRFAALCDHGGGHSIPLDAAPSVLEFFAAHPFATSPSPYADGLPASFPAYCSL